MNISDEAVEAAAKAAHGAGFQYNEIEWDNLPSPLQKHYWFMASAAIRAAAPHIMAEAWDEGRKHGASYPYGQRGLATDDNPYRSAGAGE